MSYILLSIIALICIIFAIIAVQLRKTIRSPFELSIFNRVILSGANNLNVFTCSQVETPFHSEPLLHNIRVLKGEYDDFEYYKISVHTFSILGIKVKLKTASDVTEYIILNETILEDKNQFEELYNNSFHFIGLLSTDGVLLRANDTAMEAIGTTRKEVIGSYFWETPWWQHSHIEQEKLKIAIIEAAKGFQYRFETQHLDKYNNILEIDVVLRPLLDTEHTIQYLIVEGHDITNLKSTERILKLNQKRLLALESLNFMEWENIHELTITILTTCIELTESKFGFYSTFTDDSNSESITCYSQFKDHITEPAILDDFTLFINTSSIREQIFETSQLMYENDTDFIGDSGLIINRYIAVPVLIRDELIGIAWVINKFEDYDNYDIRQLSLLVEEGIKIIERNNMREQMAKVNLELEAKVKERTTELEKSMESLMNTQDQLLKTERLAATGHLIMNVSHQLNTPIGVSITSLSYLSQEIDELTNKCNLKEPITLPDLEELKSILTIIDENLSSASNWLDKLRTIGDIRMTGAVEEIHLKDFITNVYNVLAMDTQSEDVSFSLFTSSSLSITGDSQHYKIIFRELIENSLLHGFNHQKDKKINITCEKMNDKLRIAYTDNGKGISRTKLNQMLHHVFSESETHKPWGLGLQTLINTVEKYLNGFISMDSDLGQGFSCIITIPINQTNDDIL